MPKIKTCVLSSGSKGNCTFVSIDNWKILIDCGLSRRKVKSLLSKINEDISNIENLFLTHEHHDHARGASILSKKDSIKSWTNFDTFLKIKKSFGNFDAEFFDTGDTLSFNDISVVSYEISHDAIDPVAYLIAYKNMPLIGYLKDCGMTSSFLEDAFRDVPVMIIESNHSFDLLISGDYPDFLKFRLLSKKGHLSNFQAIDFLKRIKPKIAILCHLSETNNTIDEVFSATEVYQFPQYSDHNSDTFIVIIPANSRGPIIKWLV